MPTLTGGGGRDTFVSGANNNHKQPDLGGSSPDTSHSDDKVALKDSARKLGGALSRSLFRAATPDDETASNVPTQDVQPSLKKQTENIQPANLSPHPTHKTPQLNVFDFSGDITQSFTIPDIDWHSPIYVAEKDIPDDATIFTIGGGGALIAPETFTVTHDGYLELPHNALIMAPTKDGHSLSPVDIDTLRTDAPASVTFSRDELLALMSSDKP